MKTIGLLTASALLVLGTSAFAGEGMKCGAGKCGGGMKMEKKVKKPAAKCGAGKCGKEMKQKKEAKKKAAKCGAGKCGVER